MTIKDYYRDCNFLGMKPIGILHRYAVNGKIAGSIAAIAEIQNAQPILHAPIGCGFHYRTSARTRFSPNYKLEVTNLKNKEIIFGGEEKLREEIKRADSSKQPDLIAVISSCVSAITNDDLAGMIKNEQANTKAKLIYVQPEAFSHPNKNSAVKRLKEQVENSGNKTANSKVQYQGCGFIEVMNALTEQVMQPQPVLPGTVNIETFAWGFGGAERLRMVRNKLEKINIKINCFLPTATVKEIETAPQAELNIVRRIRWAQRMKRHFSTPYLHFPSLDDWHGIEGIREFYLLIARQFGLEKAIDKILQQEWQAVQSRLASASDYLGQFRYVLATQTISRLPELIRLYELNYCMPLSAICLTLPDSYSREAGIDEAVMSKMFANIDQALTETNSRAQLFVNPSDQELHSIFKQADCIVGTNNPRFEGKGAVMLPDVHDFRPLDYEAYAKVLENLAEKIQAGKQKKNLLLSRLRFSPDYYPLLEDEDCLASREMWMRMWRTR